MSTVKLTNNKESILAGINKAADVVKSTMGAKGKNVIIASNDTYSKLRFTQDGVSVAKEIELPDPLENIGAQLLISAAKKTVEECGDGTSLTIVLLQALINYFEEELKDKDPNTLFKQLDNEFNIVVDKLKEMTTDITTTDEIKSIATVSSKSERIGNLFKEIFDETKDFDTHLSLEKSEHFNYTYYERTKGLHFDVETGFVHPSFMTNTQTEQCIYNNPYIHIFTRPLIQQADDEFRQIMEICASQNQPLVILAPKFSEAIVRTASMNKVNQGIQVCLVKTPGYGRAKEKNTKDILAFLTEEQTADKVIIDEINFTIHNSDTPNLSSHIKTLESLRDNAIELYDEQDYQKRIHKLKQTAVSIYAGANTPEAQSEEYDRIEDAIGAVQSAIQSGYVQGAGMAFIEVINSNDNIKILYKTLSKPFSQILGNANINKIPSLKFDEYVDLNNPDKVINLFEEGIIDPTKVLVSALKNAITNAKLYVNTSYTLYNQFNKTI